MIQQVYAYRNTKYFDGLDITLDGTTVNLTACKFVSDGIYTPLEAVAADITPDDEHSINYRMFLLQDIATYEYYYHFQSAYVDEYGYGGASYQGEHKLIEVLFDVTISPSSNVIGFFNIVKRSEENGEKTESKYAQPKADERQ